MTRLLLHELRNQQRLFWRSYETAFFTFLLPIILLVLLGSVYGDETIDGVAGSRYLVAGMIGYGVVAVAFAGLAINLVIRRESGVLKRVRGTPLPPSVYLAAVILSELLVIGVMVLAQLVIARYVLDAGYPSGAWSLAATILLATACFAALGLALTGLVRSSEGSSALVNAVYLPMTFISGAFFSPDTFPGFVEALAHVLPLTYLLELVRDISVRGESIGDNATAIGVLLGWTAVGIFGALRLFRWEPRER